MNQFETGNFKTKMFGGFNRRDVASYIESLAQERNTLLEENEKLTAELEQLRNAQAAAQSSEEPEAAPAASAESAKETLDEAAELLKELKAAYDAIKSDIDVSTSHAKCELTKLSDTMTSLNNIFSNYGARLDELEAKLKKDGEAL